MKPAHLALAILIAAIWGFNFIPIKLAVNEVPPFMLTALRFFFAAIPAIFFIPRPKESFSWVAAFGLMLGIGQFGFLFLAIKLGLPAGLTSLVMQLQAFFTIFFAWMIMNEVPKPQQTVGSLVAFAGMGAIAFDRWTGSQVLPLLLCITAAAGWAAANIISKMIRPQNTTSFVIWSGLAVPIPMLILSWFFEDHAQALAVFTHPSLTVVLSLLYLVVLSTIFGYAGWNYLFNHYTASTVAPFSLLIPLFGVLSAAVVFGERFDSFEIAGAVLIVLGLLVSNFGQKLWPKAKLAEPESSAS
ncbi:EamA family transporter [Aestuariivirga litoralis]|uniref:EamA family transporter n=1 Tax=Aestuariivirga litoralis TaxID=2650924 RepID=UPI0018C78CAA|nr:EamA family transporter [Aestuariivirga litoralis]MBG1231867.1 EamA family transporter [Aestuariivirga litoralis]